nr:hypothetical protein BaRGS_034169 [Batillaria attramentaria]
MEREAYLGRDREIIVTGPVDPDNTTAIEEAIKTAWKKENPAMVDSCWHNSRPYSLVVIVLIFVFIIRDRRRRESRDIKQEPDCIDGFDKEHFSSEPEFHNPTFAVDDPDLTESKSSTYYVNVTG